MLDPAGPGLIINRNRRFEEPEEDYCYCCERPKKHGKKKEAKKEEVKKEAPKVEMTVDDFWFKLIKIYQNKPKIRQMIIEAFLEANKGSDV